MTDQELLEEFTDVKIEEDGIALRILKITWPQPHTPRSSWVTVSVLPVETSPLDLDIARRQLLENTKHFRICTMCHKRNPNGWMHDDTICQSCAERHLGVKY